MQVLKKAFGFYKACINWRNVYIQLNHELYTISEIIAIPLRYCNFQHTGQFQSTSLLQEAVCSAAMLSRIM